MTKLYENIFLYATYTSYFLYAIALFGLSSIAPHYLDKLRNYLKIYVALILIYLYNPLTYKNRKFSDFDRRIVFTAGLFLLFTTTITSFVEKVIFNNIIKITI